MLNPDDQQYYMDYSGCGNTFNGNHPIVGKLILDCLRVLGPRDARRRLPVRRGVGPHPRDATATRCATRRSSWQIELDRGARRHQDHRRGLGRRRRSTRSGRFPATAWAEWNGQYRDDVRRFVKGDAGLVERGRGHAHRGQRDLYRRAGRRPDQQHQLRHLPRRVHAERPGRPTTRSTTRPTARAIATANDNNISWNCGVEGPTDDPAVEALRDRQIKNFATILLLSQGVPMFVGATRSAAPSAATTTPTARTTRSPGSTGASSRRNAGDLLRFWQQHDRVPQAHPALSARVLHRPDLNDAGPDGHRPGTARRLGEPGWNDPRRPRAGLHPRRGFDERADLHVMMNMYWERPRVRPAGRPARGGAPSTPACRRPTTSPNPARGAARRRRQPTSSRPQHRGAAPSPPDPRPRFDTCEGAES